jgi:hypothetical protein
MSSSIVHLGDLYNHLIKNWNEIIQRLDLSDGPDTGLFATLETLKMVHDKLSQSVPLLVSFVKNTESTNTSVTSGIASSIIKPGEKVLILNCGTGPIKYQYYTKNSDNVVIVLGEYKPKTISFNNYQIDGYYKVGANAVSAENMVISIQEDLNNTPWKLNENTKIVAVITGNIRKAWQSSENKDKFQEDVSIVFNELNIIPWNDTCFFITQEDEGMHESYAVSNLMKGIDSKYQCVINMGIGCGSSQWTTIRNGNPITTKHEYGMFTPYKLLSLPQTVTGQFDDLEYIYDLIQTCSSTDHPVIALKSGCLIRLERDEQLKKLVIP